jgi:hypothetical protein
MTQVVLQPCGDGLPAQHYVDTVEQLVPFEKLQQFLAKETLSDLEKLFPNKRVAAWGVTPGKRGSGENKWQRMQIGDLALFSRKGRIFSAGRVVYKIHNRELAESLWRLNDDGSAWEFMYFLQDLRSLDIPYEAFNRAAG